MKLIKILALLAIAYIYAATGSAFQTNYYVDGSCTFNGNGLADTCAASGGAAGAFLNPESCFITATAGQTCLIKNGTYTEDSFDLTDNQQGGYYPRNSGTLGNPITFKNYPGHTPVLRNCTHYVATQCQAPTITANDRSYITLDGLTVIGSIYILNEQPTTVGCDTCLLGWVIKNNTVSIGWDGDGNWGLIRIEALNGAWVHHNLLQDMDVSADQSQDQGTHIKVYQSINTIFEYNTMLGVGFEDTCIDDKENGNDNIIRFNYCDNIGGAAYQTCSYSVTPFNVCDDNLIYGNIAVNTGNLVRVQGGSGGGSGATDTDVYHNTGYGTIVCIGETLSDGLLTRVRLWNNICHGNTSENITIYAAGQSPTLSDYNTWASGRGFTIAGTGYGSLAALQAGTTLDDNSTTTACTFVNAPTDLNIASGNACETRGRVFNGSSFEATTVEVGAYGVTDCVGYTCGQAAPPATPTKMRLRIRAEDLAAVWFSPFRWDLTIN